MDRRATRLMSFRQLRTETLVFVDVFIHAGKQRLFRSGDAWQSGLIRCHLRIPLSVPQKQSVQEIYAAGLLTPLPAPRQWPAPASFSRAAATKPMIK